MSTPNLTWEVYNSLDDQKKKIVREAFMSFLNQSGAEHGTSVYEFYGVEEDNDDAMENVDFKFLKGDEQMEKKMIKFMREYLVGLEDILVDDCKEILDGYERTFKTTEMGLGNKSIGEHFTDAKVQVAEFIQQYCESFAGLIDEKKLRENFSQAYESWESEMKELYPKLNSEINAERRKLN